MPWTPLLWTDAERFGRNMLNPDETARLREYKDIRDILFGEVMRYGGAYHHPEQAVLVHGIYDKLVDAGMPADLRWDVLQAVTTAVQASKAFTVNAFLPFICQDPDTGIVSSATIDYVSCGPLLDDDPMSFPKELIRIIEAGTPRNPGAIFGGLLALGDPRLCKLLWPLKYQLSLDEAKQATRCTTGFVSAATIDFVLCWMEELGGVPEDDLFGSLAANLTRQRQGMSAPFVATGLRPFPVYSVTKDEYREMAKLIPIEEYTASIARRMIALERTEPEPKCMTLALREWGLLPPG